MNNGYVPAANVAPGTALNAPGSVVYGGNPALPTPTIVRVDPQ
jgi:hypothetical protein